MITTFIFDHNGEKSKTLPIIFQEEILVAINTLQRSPVYGHDTDFTALLGLFNCHSQNWSKMSFICPPTPVKFYCKKWYNISFSNLIFITRPSPSSIIMDLIFWFKSRHMIFPRGYPKKFLRSYSGCFNGKVKYYFEEAINFSETFRPLKNNEKWIVFRMIWSISVPEDAVIVESQVRVIFFSQFSCQHTFLCLTSYRKRVIFCKFNAIMVCLALPHPRSESDF